MPGSSSANGWRQAAALGARLAGQQQPDLTSAASRGGFSSVQSVQRVTNLQSWNDGWASMFPERGPPGYLPEGSSGEHAAAPASDTGTAQPQLQEETVSKNDAMRVRPLARRVQEFDSLMSTISRLQKKPETDAPPPVALPHGIMIAEVTEQKNVMQQRSFLTQQHSAVAELQQHPSEQDDMLLATADAEHSLNAPGSLLPPQGPEEQAVAPSQPVAQDVMQAWMAQTQALPSLEEQLLIARAATLRFSESLALQHPPAQEPAASASEQDQLPPAHETAAPHLSDAASGQTSRAVPQIVSPDQFCAVVDDVWQQRLRAADLAALSQEPVSHAAAGQAAAAPAAPAAPTAVLDLSQLVHNMETHTDTAVVTAAAANDVAAAQPQSADMQPPATQPVAAFEAAIPAASDTSTATAAEAAMPVSAPPLRDPMHLQQPATGAAVSHTPATHPNATWAMPDTEPTAGVPTMVLDAASIQQASDTAQHSAAQHCMPDIEPTAGVPTVVLDAAGIQQASSIAQHSAAQYSMADTDHTAGVPTMVLDAASIQQPSSTTQHSTAQHSMPDTQPTAGVPTVVLDAASIQQASSTAQHSAAQHSMLETSMAAPHEAAAHPALPATLLEFSSMQEAAAQHSSADTQHSSADAHVTAAPEAAAIPGPTAVLDSWQLQRTAQLAAAAASAAAAPPALQPHSTHDVATHTLTSQQLPLSQAHQPPAPRPDPTATAAAMPASHASHGGSSSADAPAVQGVPTVLLATAAAGGADASVAGAAGWAATPLLHGKPLAARAATPINKAINFSMPSIPGTHSTPKDAAAGIDWARLLGRVPAPPPHGPLTTPPLGSGTPPAAAAAAAAAAAGAQEAAQRAASQPPAPPPLPGIAAVLPTRSAAGSGSDMQAASVLDVVQAHAAAAPTGLPPQPPAGLPPQPPAAPALPAVGALLSSSSTAPAAAAASAGAPGADSGGPAAAAVPLPAAALLAAQGSAEGRSRVMRVARRVGDGAAGDWAAKGVVPQQPELSAAQLQHCLGAPGAAGVYAPPASTLHVHPDSLAAADARQLPQQPALQLHSEGVLSLLRSPPPAHASPGLPPLPGAATAPAPAPAVSREAAAAPASTEPAPPAPDSAEVKSPAEVARAFLARFSSAYAHTQQQAPPAATQQRPAAAAQLASGPPAPALAPQTSTPDAPTLAASELSSPASSEQPAQRSSLFSWQLPPAPPPPAAAATPAGAPAASQGAQSLLGRLSELAKSLVQGGGGSGDGGRPLPTQEAPRRTAKPVSRLLDEMDQQGETVSLTPGDPGSWRWTRSTGAERDKERERGQTRRDSSGEETRDERKSKMGMREAKPLAGRREKEQRVQQPAARTKADKGAAAAAPPAAASRWASKLQGLQQPDTAAATPAAAAAAQPTVAARSGAKAARREATVQPSTITIPAEVTVLELAELLGVQLAGLEEFLESLGDSIKSQHDSVSAESAELAALEFGKLAVCLKPEPSVQEPRPPVVTIMGHVDHGKTSLLDALRRTNVAAGEAGGITQHIGAFEVALPQTGAAITFLDTPGHAAFTAMRARGAAVTDIVVLVVAADDGVMPQTREALAHAQAADCPIVVAITKCDLPQAKPAAVKQQLGAAGLELEEFGGHVLVVETAATAGQGLKELEEAIMLQAELMELRAPCSGVAAEAVVVEASLDKRLGVLATVIVKQGEMKVGDCVVVGTEYGKVRAIKRCDGGKLQQAAPGQPCQIIGLKGLPLAGDQLMVVGSEERARKISAARSERADDFRRSQLAQRQLAAQQKAVSALRAQTATRKALRQTQQDLWAVRKQLSAEQRRVLEDGSMDSVTKLQRLGRGDLLPQEPQVEAGEAEDSGAAVVPLLVKADVQGSMEAVEAALLQLEARGGARVKVVYAGVGPLTESDVDLAASTGAALVAFNLPPARGGVEAAVKQRRLELLAHRVIYHLLDDVQRIMEGAGSLGEEEVVVGSAEVRATFPLTRAGRKEVGRIAGCRVKDGSIDRGAYCFRVVREGEVVWEGPASSLKRDKLDVDSVGRNTECGVVLDGGRFSDFQVGDTLLCVKKQARAAGGGGGR